MPQSEAQREPHDDLAPVADVWKALQRRMADAAKKAGAASFWDWVEPQVSCALDAEARAMMDGCLTAWLCSRPIGGRADNNPKGDLADLATALADAIEASGDATYFLPADDDMWKPERATVHLVPRLRALAEARPKHTRKSRLEADTLLIRALADIFARAGGRVTSTPSGPFGRLLAAVWEILPADQRCATAGAFVQYIKTAWPEDDPSSPLRRRPRRS
jgi:hypothetical protein